MSKYQTRAKFGPPPRAKLDPPPHFLGPPSGVGLSTEVGPSVISCRAAYGFFGPAQAYKKKNVVCSHNFEWNRTYLWRAKW